MELDINNYLAGDYYRQQKPQQLPEPSKLKPFISSPQPLPTPPPPMPIEDQLQSKPIKKLNWYKMCMIFIGVFLIIMISVVLISVASLSKKIEIQMLYQHFLNGRVN